jgi:hypothetical protein
LLRGTLKYAKDLVKRFGLDGKSHARTLMSTSVKISTDLLGKQVDPTFYRSMIGSLLYFTASRLDIAFNVGVCARFQSNPKESHLTAVRRIISYVNDTLLHNIWYSRETNLVVVGYYDADWASNAFLSLQAHFADHAQDERRALYRSSFCVSCHEDLSPFYEEYC